MGKSGATVAPRRSGSKVGRFRVQGNVQRLTEQINLALASHQKSIDGWELGEVARDIHLWAERFIFDFKIEVGTPAVTIEPLGQKKLGHFRHGRNGFGLIDEIAISIDHVRRCLDNDEYWRILGTLFHEILHQWQEHYGTPPRPNSHNYHNQEYRFKALEYGLLVDSQGHTQYKPPQTQFWDILKKYGVKIPNLEQIQIEKKEKGSSTLRKYVCPCGTKIRSGRLILRVKCMECNGLFERDD